MVKKAAFITTFLLAISGITGQSQPSDHSSQLELGTKNFNSLNIYLGYKKQLSHSIFRIRSGVDYILPSSNTDAFGHTTESQELFANIGIELQFLRDIEFITPYAGIDLVFDRWMMTRNYTFGTEVHARNNTFGPSAFIGITGNYQRYYFGIESDLAYTWTHSKWTQSDFATPETSSRSEFRVFRKPLIYLGYRF